MFELIVIDGPAAGMRVQVLGMVMVGRRDADLVIEDEEVSRRHASVRPEDGGLVIEDHGSTNGTWVNDERVSGTRRLNRGDRIRVGRTTIDVGEEGREDHTVVR